MNLIEMNSICKSYRNIGFETRVLEDVTLHIKEGEYVSLMGPSGAGKSTLMAIMGCLSQPTSGEYILDGEEVGTLNDRKLSRVRNEKIGFVFQAFHLLPGVTALENVILPLVYAKRPPGNIKEKARELLSDPVFRFQPEIQPSARFMGPMAYAAFEAGSFEDLAYFEPYYLKDFIATRK